MSDRIAEAIVASSEDAIIGETLDGMVVSWNRGAERLYGYSVEEIVGKSFSRLIPQENPDELPSILEKIRRGEHISHYETERVRKDGSRVHVSISMSPIKDDEGKIIGASAIARDISERKQVEEERARQTERESHSLSEISRMTQATMTARSLGLLPLSEAAPERFRDLVQRYAGLLDLALEERAFRVEHNLHPRLRSLAEEMGFLNAGPRDVVELHSTAVKQKSSNATPQRRRAYAAEGQLMALELMGYLASYYRRRSTGNQGETSSDARTGRRGGEE